MNNLQTTLVACYSTTVSISYGFKTYFNLNKTAHGSKAILSKNINMTHGNLLVGNKCISPITNQPET